MRFLLLCCFDEKRWGALPDSQRDEIMRDYRGLLQDLDASGQHLTSAQLKPVSTAATVRAKNGKPAVTDGPFAETKEQLGGYYVIEASDMDEAVQIAAKIPGAWIGCVEVRPIAEDEQTLRALGFAEIPR